MVYPVIEFGINSSKILDPIEEWDQVTVWNMAENYLLDIGSKDPIIKMGYITEEVYVCNVEYGLIPA